MTTEQKHTLGPWNAERVIGPRGWIITGNDGQYDIAVVRDGTGMPENEANARLIAAAPKLKDALAAMLDFWGGYECPEVDAAIAVMQELGEDRWSMQAQMEAESRS